MEMTRSWSSLTRCHSSGSRIPSRFSASLIIFSLIDHHQCEINRKTDKFESSCQACRGRAWNRCGWKSMRGRFSLSNFNFEFWYIFNNPDPPNFWISLAFTYQRCQESKRDLHFNGVVLCTNPSVLYIQKHDQIHSEKQHDGLLLSNILLVWTGTSREPGEKYEPWCNVNSQYPVVFGKDWLEKLQWRFIIILE